MLDLGSDLVEVVIGVEKMVQRVENLLVLAG